MCTWPIQPSQKTSNYCVHSEWLMCHTATTNRQPTGLPAAGPFSGNSHHNLVPAYRSDELRCMAAIGSHHQCLHSSYHQRRRPLLPSRLLLLLLHVSGRVCHYMSPQHHLYRLLKTLKPILFGHGCLS